MTEDSTDNRFDHKLSHFYNDSLYNCIYINFFSLNYWTLNITENYENLTFFIWIFANYNIQNKWVM